MAVAWRGQDQLTVFIVMQSLALIIFVVPKEMPTLFCCCWYAAHFNQLANNTDLYTEEGGAVHWGQMLCQKKDLKQLLTMITIIWVAYMKPQMPAQNVRKYM